MVRRQFVRFLVVGVANTLISFALYRLLLAVDVWYVVAAPVAWGVGAVNGYVFNRRWTFAARDSARARILYVLVLLFARAAGFGKVQAFLAALPLVTVSTFAANRYWTFRYRG